MPPRASPADSRGPSQRQLRVGELVRHALAEVMTRGEVRDPALEGAIVTIAEVRMSPDLRVATALVAPLGDQDGERIVAALGRNARFLRGRIAPALKQIKFMPELRFRLDTRFADDARIDALLRSPEVVRDLKDGGEEGPD
jgi:ribosome-binding factor A